MRKTMCFVVLVPIVLLFSCSCGNTELTILVGNCKGEVRIQNKILSGVILKELGEIDGISVWFNKKDIRTALTCPFGNEVRILENGKLITKFWVADDGCNTAATTTGSIIFLSQEVYNKLEKEMNQSNSSLCEYTRFLLEQD
ncbi:hypothetical protein CHISP_3557 [Chitinispirillum alkaliphilum]|nr:hypothetical protein CHISP_3557 [Chitinispirillum alkaliphilum]